MEISRIEFDEIDSTNSWAMEHASELEADKLSLVVAKGQSAGRGRFDRSWVSPRGENVYATFVFFRDKLWDGVGHVPQVLAMSAVEVLEGLGFKPRLKWPNDVLLSEKKVAGILAETTHCEHGVAVVVGIGINVNMSKERCDSIDRPATSLRVEASDSFYVEQVIDLLAARFSNRLAPFLRDGFAPFLSRFRELVQPPTAQISFSDGRTVWKGKQVGITEEGALLLELASGEVKTFHAGEILFV